MLYVTKDHNEALHNHHLLLVLSYVDSKRKHKHGGKHRPKPRKEGGGETTSGFQKHSFETVLQIRLRFSQQILYNFNKCIAALCHIEEQCEFELLVFFLLYVTLYVIFARSSYMLWKHDCYLKKFEHYSPDWKHRTITRIPLNIQNLKLCFVVSFAGALPKAVTYCCKTLLRSLQGSWQRL